MVNFILKENPFLNMNEYFTNRVEAFKKCVEFSQLTDYERTNNSIICVTFRNFFERILKNEYEKSLDDDNSNTLNLCYNVMNELATSEHSEGERILREEIFYNLQLEEKYFVAFYSKLNNKAKKIFSSLKENQ